MTIDYHALAIVGALVLLDIASGLAQAFANRSLSSEKMRAGAYHKGAYVLFLALAIVLEYGANHLDLGFSVPLFLPCCAYIAITESLSIIENVARINPDLRKSPLFDLLGQSQNRRATDAKDDEES